MRGLRTVEAHKRCFLPQGLRDDLISVDAGFNPRGTVGLEPRIGRSFDAQES